MFNIYLTSFTSNNQSHHLYLETSKNGVSVGAFNIMSCYLVSVLAFHFVTLMKLLKLSGFRAFHE